MTTTPIRPTLDEEAEYYRVLWYGDPGKTKTTSIAEAAKFGRVIYIDAENGLKAKALRRHGIPIENIEPYRDVTYKGLEKLHHEVLLRIQDGEEIFAVAWDTTTKTLSQFLEDISLSKVGDTTKSGHIRTEDDIFLDDYGDAAQQMRRILRRLHNLPCHVLLGAHQRRDVDDESGKVRIGPAVSPAVGVDFNGYMDCIIHMRTETYEDPDLLDGLEVSGLTRPAGRFDAKDRFGLLPKNMINPGFDRVKAYLDGELVKENDPLQQAARARRAQAKPELVVTDGKGSTELTRDNGDKIAKAVEEPAAS